MSQLQPRTPVLRPEPLPSVKEAGLLSCKLFLIQVAFINGKSLVLSRHHGNLLNTLPVEQGK